MAKLSVGGLSRGGFVAALLAQRGHPADVVAAQVQQHQVLGPLLGVG
jgi:esterase/lipase